MVRVRVLASAALAGLFLAACARGADPTSEPPPGQGGEVEGEGRAGDEGDALVRYEAQFGALNSSFIKVRIALREADDRTIVAFNQEAYSPQERAAIENAKESWKGVERSTQEFTADQERYVEGVVTLRIQLSDAASAWLTVLEDMGAISTGSDVDRERLQLKVRVAFDALDLARGTLERVEGRAEDSFCAFSGRRPTETRILFEALCSPDSSG